MLLHSAQSCPAPDVASAAASAAVLCSAVLAHALLNEKLNVFGMVGCLLCVTGSIAIVLHAPPERHLGSVVEVWQLAMQPGEDGGFVDLDGGAGYQLHHGNACWVSG